MELNRRIFRKEGGLNMKSTNLLSRPKILIGLLLILCLSLSGLAQTDTLLTKEASVNNGHQTVNEPKVGIETRTVGRVSVGSSFYAAPNVLELADIQLRMVDATSTYQFQHHPCRCFHEGDPLMPDDGRAGVIALSQAGYTMAIIGGSRWLDHRGHHKLSRILLWSDIASESFTVSRNYWKMGNAPQLPINAKKGYF